MTGRRAGVRRRLFFFFFSSSSFLVMMFSSSSSSSIGDPSSGTDGPRCELNSGCTQDILLSVRLNVETRSPSFKDKTVENKRSGGAEIPLITTLPVWVARFDSGLCHIDSFPGWLENFTPTAKVTAFNARLHVGVKFVHFLFFFKAYSL